jgi:integrase
MPRPRPPFLHREESRHGRVMWFVRRKHGARIRLRAEYGSEAFWAEYRAALEGAPLPSKEPKAQTLAWALDLYRASSSWGKLANSTRRQRENIYRAAIKSAGDVSLKSITDNTIKAGRERRKATPHSANIFLKAMRAFFAWAIEDKLVTLDPTKGVKLLPGPNDADGFHTWTQAELDRFEAHWPVGTRERLSYDLLLYTGLRRGVAVRVGGLHEREGVITIRTEKTGEPVSIPILPPLAASIAATRTGDLTYLVTEAGQPWVKESFGNWFRKICRRAGCPGSAHGLRKAGATRAAERGATERQLMAIFGWSTGKMAQHYTRAADRTRLARDAAQFLLLPDPNALTSDPVRAPTKKETKNQRRTNYVVPRGGMPRLSRINQLECQTGAHAIFEAQRLSGALANHSRPPSSRVRRSAYRRHNKQTLADPSTR